MGSIGGSELFLILIIALLVFGPRKLPEIGRTMGRTMAGFRRAASDLKMDLEREVNMEKVRETTKEITDARDQLKRVTSLDPLREAVGLDNSGGGKGCPDEPPADQAPGSAPDPGADQAQTVSRRVPAPSRPDEPVAAPADAPAPESAAPAPGKARETS